MARRTPLTDNNTLLPPQASLPEEMDVVLNTPEDEESDPDDLGEPIEDEDGNWVYGAQVEEEEEEVEDTDVIDLEEFFQNLAEDEAVLEEVQRQASAIEELVQEDIEARKQRDEQQAEGIKRTGLGKEAPGGAEFDGASKAVHPILTTGCIDFAARTAKELLPPAGPVKQHIVGKPTKEKIAKADRKRQYMNWQLTKQIKEYRTECEQLWTQIPLGGSGYQHWMHNGKRASVEFVPVDLVILAANTSSFDTSPRITIREDRIGEEEFQSRVRKGEYKDPESSPDVITPETTESEQATDKIEGREDPSTSREGVRGVFTIYLNLNIEADKKISGEAPYKLVLEQDTCKVLQVQRNWDPTEEHDDDDVPERMDWLVQWDFFRWRGALGIGLGQMIGSLAGSITGGIRALLDSAHINNSATLLKLKGANIGGQSTYVDVTGVAEIEGPAGLDDIRKLAMPFPFNPPSTVLFTLVEFLVKEAKAAVASTDEMMNQLGPNTPVATMMAAVEQNSITYSSIHSRMHESQRRSFEILHRINKFWLEDEEVVEELGELVVRREDFEGPMDVLPVSDPLIFSEAQRAAQVQGTLDLNTLFPGMMNQRALLKRALQVLRTPDPEELLPEEQKPTPKNPVAENLEMFMGQPAFAFPDQDHEAHMQVHLAFLMDQNFGSNPAYMSSIVGNFLEHFKQHMGFWYVDTALSVLSSVSGIDMSKVNYESPEAQEALARALAEAAPYVMQESQRVLGQLGPILAKLSEIASQVAQSQQQQAMAMAGKTPDPSRMAEVERKTQKDQVDAQLKDKELSLKGQQSQLRGQEVAVRAQSEQQRTQLQAQRDAADSRHKDADRELKSDQLRRQEAMERIALQMKRIAEQEGIELDWAALQNEVSKIESDVLMNMQDNHTALRIAAERLSAGKAPGVSNGNGLDRY